MSSLSLSSLYTVVDDEVTAKQSWEASANERVPEEFFEKCAKMEMELFISRIRELELEKKALKAELGEQKLLTEQKDQFNGQLLAVQKELLEKIDKLEKGQQKEEKEGREVENESDGQQMALLERLMDKMGAVDASVWALNEQMGKACAGKLADIENAMAQMQTAQKEISAKISTVESVVGILKDQVKKAQNNWWDANACHNDLEVIWPKCLVAHYKGNGKGHRSLFAKHPISRNDSDIFYFEVKVENTKGWTSIGVATKAMPLVERAGEHSKDSYGYTQGGRFWICGSKKYEGLSTFGGGDVVGCGVNLTNRRLFFTKNGQHLANTDELTISTPIDSLFPCVSLHESGDKVLANFGPHFKFDVGTFY